MARSGCASGTTALHSAAPCSLSGRRSVVRAGRNAARACWRRRSRSSSWISNSCAAWNSAHLLESGASTDSVLADNDTKCLQADSGDSPTEGTRSCLAAPAVSETRFRVAELIGSAMRQDSYWNVVPAEEIYRIFKRIIIAPGFQLISKGMLAKQVNDEIIHLIKLTAYKGAIYGLQWGVSLTYVPQRWENELRWHRSFTSAVFDLSDELNDMPEHRHLVEFLQFDCFPSALHGPKLFEKNLKRDWEEVRPILTGWLDRANHLQGVLLRAEEQMQRAWPGPHHWPPPSLVHAFTLARLGRAQQAMAELNAIICNEVRDPNGKLATALQKARTTVNSGRLESASADSVK